MISECKKNVPQDLLFHDLWQSSMPWATDESRFACRGTLFLRMNRQKRKSKIPKFSRRLRRRDSFWRFFTSKTDVFIFFRTAKKNRSVTQHPESKPRALILVDLATWSSYCFSIVYFQVSLPGIGEYIFRKYLLTKKYNFTFDRFRCSTTTPV